VLIIQIISNFHINFKIFHVSINTKWYDLVLEIVIICVITHNVPWGDAVRQDAINKNGNH
jgi:hypothetical protein